MGFPLISLHYSTSLAQPGMQGNDGSVPDAFILVQFLLFFVANIMAHDSVC